MNSDSTFNFAVSDLILTIGGQIIFIVIIIMIVWFGVPSSFNFPTKFANKVHNMVSTMKPPTSP